MLIKENNLIYERLFGNKTEDTTFGDEYIAEDAITIGDLMTYMDEDPSIPLTVRVQIYQDGTANIGLYVDGDELINLGSATKVQ